MVGLSRRRFLSTGVGVTAGAVAGSVLADPAMAAVPALPSTPFALGVASGDPWSTSVVLWTRLAPKPTVEKYGMEGQPEVMPVKWRIARTTADLAADSTSVDFGTFNTVSDDVHSVHAIANGLSPETNYVYQFFYTEPNGKRWSSPIGNTRTTPAAGSTTPARFAVVSCQTIGTQQGGWRYFNGYGYMNDNAAALDLDFVVQIGDYIYSDPAIDSSDPPWDTAADTLPKYRLRYGKYRMRSSLQEIHRAKPFYASPDDHEWWNNVHGGVRNLTAGTIDGEPIERFNWALRAYWEHMPLRYRPTLDSATGIRSVQLHRNIDWGSVMCFHLLDTRQFRNKPGTGTGATMMGGAQRQELLDKIATSTQTWNCVTSQVPMGSFVDSTDKWIGYPYERGLVTSALATARDNGTLPNAVVVSGDIHCGLVAKVNQQGGSNFIATEFVGPPMTSGESSGYTANGTIDHVFTTNGNVQHGFMLCHVDQTRFDATWYLGDDITNPNGAVTKNLTYRAVPGRVGAVRV